MKFPRKCICLTSDSSQPIRRDTARSRVWRLPLRGRDAATALGTAIAALSLIVTVAAADEPGLKPEVATSLSRLGITFVVGTYKEISESGKSSVPAADAAVIGDQAKALVDQYKGKVREGAFGANLLYTTLDVAITGAQVMGSATDAAASSVPIRRKRPWRSTCTVSRARSLFNDTRYN